MNSYSFPLTRMRRTRTKKFIRDLVKENRLTVNDLIYPIFIVDGTEKKEPIPEMPGLFRFSLDNLEKEVKKADLILTAEGKIDSQSTKGKLTGSIAHLAKKNSVKIIGIAGAIKGPYEHLYKKGFTGVFPIQNGPISLEESIKNTRNLITDTASRIIAYHLNNKKKP